jgi:hypothetical protein
MQFTLLWKELERVPREVGKPDKITWKGSASSRYTASATYGIELNHVEGISVE